MKNFESVSRILFMGQKLIGQQTFARLSAQGERLTVVGVVSNTSTNCWWGDNEIYRICRARRMPFIDNAQRNNDAISRLVTERQVGCILSVQHPWILPSTAIASVDGFAFNLHLAPLPNFKGWYGVNHAILQALDSFGVSLHWLDQEVDSGDLAYSAVVPIHADDTARSLYGRCEEAGLRIFDLLLEDLAACRTPPRHPLRGEHESYERSALDVYREITSLENPDEVERRVRALYFPPFEPAFVRVGCRKIYLTPSYHEVCKFVS